MDYFIFLGFIAAFIVFILPTRMLIQTYKWLASVAAIAGSYWTNVLFLNGHDPLTTDAFINFGTHFFIQSLFALVFCYNYFGPRDVAAQRGIVVVFMLPSLLNIIPPVGHPPWTNIAVLAATIALLYVSWGVLINLNYLYTCAKLAIQRSEDIMHHRGLHVLLQTEWLRLKVPHVLRLFWLIRFLEHVIFYALTTDSSSSSSSLPTDETRDSIGCTVDMLLVAGKQLLVQGCDTVVAVLGMTSVVASVAHYLSCAVQQFLVVDDDEEKSFGTVSAILFFILALQTGLTGLEPEKRFIRLYRNFCLLFTAILHFTHNIVNPLLMSLSASRNRSVQHHGRALLVCAFLLAFPCWLLAYLWRTHHVSTWLLAVSAFSIEVTIKVVISLLIYSLFMYDAYRNSFWEKLDDYVYYVRATGNTIEFIFGIFLFFNGAWILLFESGGTVRACMMCIHAYFNIWMQAKAGWKVFVRRRTAVNKINSFAEASAEQLQQLDDVCAICYQEMTTARITRCQHYFHGLCLRKWLYIQDRCPMCHSALYELSADDSGSEAEVAEDLEHVDNVLENQQRDGSQQRNVLEHQHQD